MALGAWSSRRSADAGQREHRLPSPIVAAITVAWVIAAGAELSGVAASVHHDSLLEDGAGFGPALLLFVLAWQVMAAAMMLPASLPLLTMVTAASAHPPGERTALAAFLGGYALVWSGFGALAFSADAALHAAVDSSAWLAEHDWAVGPAVVLVAGAYQFSALKGTCLRGCRHPAPVRTGHSRCGPRGGLLLGARHGLACVGSSWALMLIMFAAGAPSLMWMAALTAVMVHEQARPAGLRTAPLIGVVLLAAGSTLGLWGAYANGAV